MWMFFLSVDPAVAVCWFVCIFVMSCLFAAAAADVLPQNICHLRLPMNISANHAQFFFSALYFDGRRRFLHGQLGPSFSAL